MRITWAEEVYNTSSSFGLPLRGFAVNTKPLRDNAEEIGLTMFLFGLLTWLYVIGVQLLHPYWVTLPLSHLGFPPFNWRVDDVGMLSFAVSVIGFLIWRIQAKKSGVDGSRSKR